MSRHHHHGFGDVNGAPAAQPDHAVAAAGLIEFHRVEHVVFDRVPVYAVEESHDLYWHRGARR